ncbi:TPA: hypothetical protein ACSCYS_003319 [Aeromonas veronii]|nr:hypothetical protein [Aeromonas veronii]
MNQSGLYLDTCLNGLIHEAHSGKVDGERNAKIMSAYFGFDGQGTCSMGEAGEAYDISKERVRQIKDQTVTDLQVLLYAKPEIESFMNSVIEFAASAAPISFTRLEQKLKEDNFCIGDFKFNGVMSYIKLVCDDVPFERVLMESAEFIVPKMIAITTNESARAEVLDALRPLKLLDANDNLIDPFCYKMQAVSEFLNAPVGVKHERNGKTKIHFFSLHRVVINIAVKNIIHNGAVTFEYVAKETLKEFPYFSWETIFNFTGDLLRSKDGFEDLGVHDDEQWFWLTNAGRNRFYNKARKAIAVAKRLSVAVLTDEMNKKQREQEYPLPVKVVEQLMAGRDEFSLDGGYLVCNKEPDLSDILSEQESQMVEIMRDHKVLNHSRFFRLCEEKGVKPYSFRMILNYQPLFIRQGKGEYALIGSK